MARSDSFQKKWAAVPSQFERPSDALIDRGWAGGAAEDPPEAKWENWWHNRVDEALAEIEKNGAMQWFADVPYGIGAVVRSDSKNWIAAIANTEVEPGGVEDAGHWMELSLEIASQAEAEAGIDNTKRMSPLRVKQAINAGLPFGYFSGFTMSNSASAPNTSISVSAGSARSSDNAVSINLAIPLSGILQASGAWAAGDNQNKLDAGNKASSSKYHVHAIRREADGAADILFSLSATAPTMPSGYAGFRRIGTIFTDGSGNIRGFLNAGNLFIFKTPVLDVNTSSGPTNGTYTLTLPDSVSVLARLAVASYTAGDSAAAINSPSGSKITATSSPASYNGGAFFNTTATDQGGWEFTAMAENAQLVFSSVGYLRVLTLGYEELRN